MDAVERELRKSRDPLSSLALADYLEEQGMDEHTVSYHRAMGEWGQVMYPLWLDLACRRYPRKRVVKMGGVAMLVTGHDRTVRIHEAYGRLFIVMSGPIRALSDERNPSVALDYDNPSNKQWRYLKRRLRDIAKYFTHPEVIAAQAGKVDPSWEQEVLA